MYYHIYLLITLINRFLLSFIYIIFILLFLLILIIIVIIVIIIHYYCIIELLYIIFISIIVVYIRFYCIRIYICLFVNRDLCFVKLMIHIIFIGYHSYLCICLFLCFFRRLEYLLFIINRLIMIYICFFILVVIENY